MFSSSSFHLISSSSSKNPYLLPTFIGGCFVVGWWLKWARNLEPRRLFHSRDLQIEYDFIVVGSGPSGCVVTCELIKAGFSVLLLEAGAEYHRHPLTHDAHRFISLRWTDLDWDYHSTPQNLLENRLMTINTGKTTGGGSAVNGTAWVRGCKEDYDQWAKEGNEGWDYASLLPLFKKLEHYEAGNPENRGKNGYFHVSDAGNDCELARLVVRAAEDAGIKFNEDYNSGHHQGVSYGQTNTLNGKRLDAFTVLIEPLIGHPNLKVVSKALAHRVIFENNVATGVEFFADNKMHQVYASKEVILSAGSIGSPKLLMLSGVGPRDHLEQFNIPVVFDNEYVGKNYQDHICCPIPMIFKKSIQSSTEGGGVQNGVIFIKSNWSTRYAPHRGPDLQIGSAHGRVYGHAMGELIFAPLLTNFFASKDTVLGKLWRNIVFSLRYLTFLKPLGNRFATFGCILNQVNSRGVLRLASSNPRDHPQIDPNTFACPEDKERLIEAVQIAERILRRDSLREVCSVIQFLEGSEEEKERKLKKKMFYIWHPVGTCKMGVSSDSVVNSKLEVRGVTKLRVIDASIMPNITSGNTHVPR